MTTTELTQMKRHSSILLKKLNDRTITHLYYDNTVADTNKLEYNRITPDQQAFAIMNGDVGTISDCFILYMIARLRCTDFLSLQRAMHYYSKLHPEYTMGSLAFSDSKADFLRARLRDLFKAGLICHVRYDNSGLSPTVSDTDVGYTGVSLLMMLTPSGLSLMNRRLKRHLPESGWGFFFAAPVYDLIGTASSAYIASCLMKYPTFKEFGPGIFSTKIVGTAYVDAELRFKAPSGVVNVAIIPSYLHKEDRRILDDESYKADRNRKLDIIRNYLYCKIKNSDDARVIICCETYDDLKEISSHVYRLSIFDSYRNKIYFTGEGIAQSLGGDMHKALLSITDVVTKSGGTEKKGYTFINPDCGFLA